MWLVIASAPTSGFLSKITVLKPPRDVYRAQLQPAGPPPTIATSHWISLCACNFIVLKVSLLKCRTRIFWTCLGKRKADTPTAKKNNTHEHHGKEARIDAMSICSKRKGSQRRRHSIPCLPPRRRCHNSLKVSLNPGSFSNNSQILKFYPKFRRTPNTHQSAFLLNG